MSTTYLLPLSPEEINIHRQALISFAHEHYRMAETSGLPASTTSLLRLLARSHMDEADRLTAMIQHTANINQEHHCHVPIHQS
jgi:hypothetical protein